MPSDTITEAAHEALRNGVEKGLARVISEGNDPEKTARFISARIGSLPQTDVSYITELANAMIKSAMTLSNISPDDPLPIEDIPINGDLFGDEFSGKRIYWQGEWNIPGTDEWYKFSGTVPDALTFGEIVVSASELASGYIGESPNKFTSAAGGVPSSVNVRITGTERLF